MLAAWLVGPAIAQGGLAGSPAAEVYGHAWVQGWAAAQWPAWPSGTPLAEGASVWPVIDPLPTWIVGLLAQFIGGVAAWNAWLVGGIVLAAVGGGAFARALGGDGRIGAAGVATMPIFLGSLTSGLTEDYALGLVALALAALLRERRLLGGVLLGISALCGLYLAWLGAWAALAIGLRRIRVLPARWVLAGLLAVGIATPAVLPFRARLGGEGHRSGTVPARVEPLWRIDPWRGADLASFGAPGKVDLGGAFVREHPVYLGYATLALAAAGGFHPAWLGVVACAAVAPGEHLSWMGRPLGMNNPMISAFRALPFADRFNHHARAMLLGQLLLVGLAARGGARIGGWRTRPWMVPGVLAGGLVAETALGSAARFPLPVTPAESPGIYRLLAAFPDDLPVAVVGAAGPGIHPQRVFFDQRAHGRRLLHNPNRPKDGVLRGAGIVVALGDAVPRVTAERGEPGITAADGAAWAVSGGP